MSPNILIISAEIDKNGALFKKKVKFESKICQNKNLLLFLYSEVLSVSVMQIKVQMMTIYY